MMREKARSPRQVRILLMGTARTEIRGRVITSPLWRRRAVRGLATLLGTAPSSKRDRDGIVEALWPDLGADSAANQLHKAVHHLRRVLDPEGDGRELVVVEGERIGFTSQVSVHLADVLREADLATRSDRPGQVESVLAQAGDPLLPDDPYEPWAMDVRGQIDSSRRRLLRRLAELRVEQGELAGAESALEDLLLLDPADEWAHRELMRIAARRMDWRTAVRRYEWCRDRLWQDVGVEPSPETERLRQEILSAMLAASPSVLHEDRAALLEQLGDAVRQTGQARTAVDLYEGALILYGPVDDQAARRTRGKLALTHIATGDLTAAESQMRPIRESLEREWPAYLTARTLYLLAQLRWHSGRYREALDAAERAVRAARASHDLEQHARAQEVFALACHALGDWRRGMVAELERQRIAAETGFGFDEVLEAHLCLWEYSLYGDRPFDAVEASVAAALHRAEEAGNVAAMAVAEHAMGSVLMVLGRWADARLALYRSIRFARAVGAPQGTVLGLQRLALLETVSGHVDTGHERIREAMEFGRASDSVQVQRHSFSRMNATLALNRFLGDDLEAAREALVAGGRVQQDAGECITCDSLIHPIAVPIHLAGGDVAAAEEEAKRTTATATSFRSRSRAAVANHAAGLVLAAQGRMGEAERRLARAAAVFESTGQPYDHARSLVALVAVRRVMGHEWHEAEEQAATILDRLVTDRDPDRLTTWFVQPSGGS
jgi:DNA-binding SARP family transcriptional activator